MHYSVYRVKLHWPGLLFTSASMPCLIQSVYASHTLLPRITVATEIHRRFDSPIEMTICVTTTVTFSMRSHYRNLHDRWRQLAKKLLVGRRKINCLCGLMQYMHAFLASFAYRQGLWGKESTGVQNITLLRLAQIASAHLMCIVQAGHLSTVDLSYRLQIQQGP